MVLSANEIVRKHCKIADKLSVIYLADRVFFGGRYAFRFAVGMRDKVKVKSLVRGAEKRKN